MVYRFFTTFRNVKIGDEVLLRAKEREESGVVVFVSEEGSRESFQDRRYVGVYDGSDVQEMGIYILSGEDRAFFKTRAEKELAARVFCREKIREMKLEMKLSRVSYLFKNNKALFYFTAENRVDFRELVRVLGSHLKIRVEMRHVGVRDETKILGGIGLCGNEFCCSKHLKKFHPVSVRMAKNQELSLNPDGISGTCGRLLCCLEYENATYQQLREGLPKIKKSIRTVDGREGVVGSVLPLLESVVVHFNDGTHSRVGKCDLCVKQAGVTPDSSSRSGSGGSGSGGSDPGSSKQVDGRPARSSQGKGSGGRKEASSKSGQKRSGGSGVSSSSSQDTQGGVRRRRVQQKKGDHHQPASIPKDAASDTKLSNTGPSTEGVKKVTLSGQQASSQQAGGDGATAVDTTAESTSPGPSKKTGNRQRRRRRRLPLAAKGKKETSS